MKRSEARKREKYSGCFDIIEPVTGTTRSEPVNGQTAKQSQTIIGKDHLFVEGLAGYGDAQRWALDLKTDLEAFKTRKSLVRSQLTAAALRAARNRQDNICQRRSATPFSVPLIATSVARWLETSHLGDVLAAMNATFEQAKESLPAFCSSMKWTTSETAAAQ
jgi:cell division protease FtsH